ncbi:MAG: glycosyltransferase family 2 protein [Candidatus Acidiferrales bacterium]
MKWWSLLALYMFGISFVLVAYTYFVYPLLLFVLYGLVQLRSDVRYLLKRSDRRVGSRKGDVFPGVTFIVPAYNEEACLSDKIENLRQMDYPKEKLQIVFISDGSTDRTNQILSALPDENVQVVILPQRMGKPSALNRGVTWARHEILVFSDSSTLFAPDAVRNLVRHFSDAQIGAVCGSVKLEGNLESQQTEGTYWKFESVLRLMESRLGAILNASGAIYALRRNCYRPLEPGDLIDDFLIPLNARQAGYRVLEDPEVVAIEFSSGSVKAEFTRRVRLAVGSFRALEKVRLADLRGFTAIAFVSHKLLRWVLPFLLIALFVSNLFLLRHPLYRVFFAAQLIFYLWGVTGLIFRERMKKVRYALIAYFLLTIHFAFLVGFWRWLFGGQEATWQRVN